MAIRRRRRTTNPKRRRRTNKRRAVTVVNRRRRRANPVRRRRRTRRVSAAPRTNRRRRTNPRRRRRNPGLLTGAGGLLQNSITAIVGMGIVNFLYNAVGSMVPGGMPAQIGVKLGLAYGVGIAARKFGFASHANMLAIGGAVSAGQDAFNYFVGGGGLFFPQPKPQLSPGQAYLPAGATADDYGGGMSDMVYANRGYFGDIVWAQNQPGMYN